MEKSYFADEEDCNFFGRGTLCKLLIYFDCVTQGEWNGPETKPAKDAVQSFKKLQQMGYALYLIEVPEKKEILDWLDATFDYPFTCNDYPTRYADLSDHWTTVSKNTTTSLCSEGFMDSNRDIHFENNWLEICKMIEENDVLARTNHGSYTFDDRENEKSDVMNHKTTEFLKEIAVPETPEPVDYGFKPTKELWTAKKIIWNVKPEITEKYGVTLLIEQGSLHSRGTWLTVTAKKVDRTWLELLEVVKKFCKDYGIDVRKELSFVFPYDLPLIEE